MRLREVGRFEARSLGDGAHELIFAQATVLLDTGPRHRRGHVGRDIETLGARQAGALGDLYQPVHDVGVPSNGRQQETGANGAERVQGFATAGDAMWPNTQEYRNGTGALE